jgi:hypothetical protein
LYNFSSALLSDLLSLPIQSFPLSVLFEEIPEADALRKLLTDSAKLVASIEVLRAIFEKINEQPQSMNGISLSVFTKLITFCCDGILKEAVVSSENSTADKRSKVKKVSKKSVKPPQLNVIQQPQQGNTGSIILPPGSYKRRDSSSDIEQDSTTDNKNKNNNVNGEAGEKYDTKQDNELVKNVYFFWILDVTFFFVRTLQFVFVIYVNQSLQK